jgi:hypothetical protein
VDTLGSLLPITSNDRLLTGFFGCGDLSTPPAMDAESHISGARQTAIKSAMERAPNGVVIAVEIHAVG